MQAGEPMDTSVKAIGGRMRWLSGRVVGAYVFGPGWLPREPVLSHHRRVQRRARHHSGRIGNQGVMWGGLQRRSMLGAAALAAAAEDLCRKAVRRWRRRAGGRALSARWDAEGRRDERSLGCGRMGNR